jgi:ADP-ribose pyrophosphatase YjhB (NUDIX family)
MGQMRRAKIRKHILSEGFMGEKKYIGWTPQFGEQPRNFYYRSGIIPFCIENGELWFCLGRDMDTKELTDFGGGVKKNETIMEGAFREFQEETGQLFEDFAITNGAECLEGTTCISSRSMSIMFLPVSPTIKGAITKKNMANVSKEIYSVEWIKAQDLFLGKRKEMWKKISYFLYGSEIIIMHILNHVYWY